MSFVVFIVVLMIPLVLNQETPGYYFAGGILGIISSVSCLFSSSFFLLHSNHLLLLLLQGIVLVSHIRSGARRSASMTLLFFRALCDMGIGFRFVMDQYFNESLCHQKHCHIDDGVLPLLSLSLCPLTHTTHSHDR